MAFKVGVLAHFIGGAVFIIGAFVVPKILKIVPAGALFGSLAGGAMAFLILQSMDGTLKMPLVGWLSLIVSGEGKHQAARGSDRHCGGSRHCLGHRLYEFYHCDGFLGKPQLLHS